ncbi:MAG: SMC-Scp complex subunit ScpB [Patescibacteria group bacterium]
MNIELINKIEAILFYSSEPVKASFLAKVLEVGETEILESLKLLEETLGSRGIRLLSHQNEVSLVTAPEYSSLIEAIVKEERERDLGKASLETLAIVAYKGPVTKKEIEYIRGVNSQYALRSLLLRGLVEKKGVEGDERMVGYTITADALRHLGLSKLEDLPEYTAVKQEIHNSLKNEETVAEETQE